MVLVTAAAFLTPVLESRAAGLSQATVTNVQEEVWMVQPGQEPRSASVGSVVSGSTAVRTGVKSLAEITFSDKTLLRLGSNSQFSFQEGLREVNLRSGTALFQVPKGSGGLRVRTGSITAAITGSEAKVKAPTPGEGGAFLLLNLHGTMKAVFEDESFAGGEVPLPLPPPRGLKKLFAGANPDFSVELKPGEGFYAFLDADGKIIPSTVRKFIFDLEANIGSGLLTGSGGGVTEGTRQAADEQAEKMKDGGFFASTSVTPLPGSFQSLAPSLPQIRTMGRDQAIVDGIAAQRVAAQLAAQQAAIAAREASRAAANAIRRQAPVPSPGVDPDPVQVPVQVPAPAPAPVQEVVFIPQVVIETPPTQSNTPTTPTFDPTKLPFCEGIPSDLPYPTHGNMSNCLPPPNTSSPSA